MNQDIILLHFIMLKNHFYDLGQDKDEHSESGDPLKLCNFCIL